MGGWEVGIPLAESRFARNDQADIEDFLACIFFDFTTSEILNSNKGFCFSCANLNNLVDPESRMMGLGSR